MTQVLTDRQPAPAAWQSPVSLPMLLTGVGYLAGYVLLDWVSFIHPFTPFGITPWNPCTGLGFALTLLIGWRFVPLLVVAPVMADILVRGWPLPLPLPVVLASGVILGVGHGVSCLLLLLPRLRFDPALPSMRDLILLMAIAVVGTAAVAAAYVGLLIGADHIKRADFFAAALRQWVGDTIGIAVVTPFVLLWWHGRARIPRLSWETALQITAILATLALVYVAAEHLQFGLFYVLFFPIIWIAVRSGIEGVSAGIVLTQISLIAILLIDPQPELDVVAVQAKLLVLAMTGLAAGMLVTERQRTEHALRLHQDALSHLGKLGSMGELAGALAHEINQPLMAASTYSRTAAELLESPTGDKTRAIEPARKAAAQIERAAEMVRRLRNLIRLGSAEVTPVSVDRLVRETLQILAPDIERAKVIIRDGLDRDLPLVKADILQIEQVLFNLLRNAIEASTGHRQSGGAIVIAAQRGEPGFIEISVRDTGPGFPPEIMRGDIAPFFTTKPQGLGIGLSLCRSIITAHGGQLQFGGDSRGAVASFTLPIAEADHA